MRRACVLWAQAAAPFSVLPAFVAADAMMRAQRAKLKARSSCGQIFQGGGLVVVVTRSGDAADDGILFLFLYP
jgi:hypothetical protein